MIALSFILVTAVYIFLICTFYFFSFVHDIGSSPNELNNDLEESYQDGFPLEKDFQYKFSF